MKLFMFKAVIIGFILGFGYTQIYASSPHKETKAKDETEETKPTDQRTRTVVIGVTEPTDVIIRITTMKHKRIQDAGIPRFIISDKNDQFAFGIGGVLRSTVGSEFGGIVNTPMNEGMLPSLIPISYNGLPRSQLRMSASTSQIFLKMVGSLKWIGNIETFVSIDFHGNNYTPQLRQAYLKLGNFTFGQAWSAMVDLNASPTTIDFDGPISMVGVRTPQIRYDRHLIKNKLNFAVSLEYPTVNASYSPNTKAIAQSIPNVVGLLQYDWGQDKKSHLRISGLLRNMSYYNKIDSKTEIDQGWGVQLTAAINFLSDFKFYGQAIYGYGIAGYMNDPSYLNVDLLPESPNSEYMRPMEIWGFTAGLKYDITKDVHTSVSYSYNRLYKGDNVVPNLEIYKYAQYIAANVFWNFIDNCSIAIEYLRGSRMTFNDSFGKANRINLLAQYTF